MKGPLIGGGDPSDRSLLERAVRHLSEGGILAYPTETVYGLGAPADADGVEAIRSLKGRGSDRPFLLLIPGPGFAGFPPDRWGLVRSSEAERVAAALWPGPLTMVLSDPEARFPPGVRSPSGGVAVRVSSHPYVEALMALWRRPLISTSANRSGVPAARSADEVVRMMRDAPGVERLWIVDGGRLPDSPPSTVIDFTGDRPRLVREGAIPRDELSEVLSEALDDDGT